MGRSALLICGSGALAESAGAELWARARLAEAFDEAAADTVVLLGRSPHAPDQWAAEHAQARRLHTVEYDGRRGARYQDGRCTGYWYRQWSPDWKRLDDEARLRERDRVLVRALLAARARGWAVAVLALLAPWARAHGTADVVRGAGAAGLPVTMRQCPLELGPA